MRARIVLLVLVLLLVSLSTTLAQDEPLVTDDLLAEFETFIEGELGYYSVPGAAVAIVENGELVFAQGFGVRDASTGEPVTADTIFRVGSITKSMTAMMVAQLVDEGLMYWDDPVDFYWPDFGALHLQLDQQLRVQDLMSMGTGLVTNAGEDALYWDDWSVDELFDSLSRMEVGGDFLEFYSYNNEVYATAAYVAMSAAGMDPTLENYVEMMETRVFAPLDMDNTVITDDVSDLGDNYAVSYSFSLVDGLDVPYEVPVAPIGIVAPSGAVWSNVYDMANYAITQMNDGVAPDGTEVVSAQNLQKTWEGQVTIDSENPVPGVSFEDQHYAMGWVTQSYNGVPIRFHDGGWEGHRAYLAFYPDVDVAIVILTNHQMGEFFNMGLTYALAEMLHGTDAVATDALHGFYGEMAEQLNAAQGQLPPAEVDEAMVADFLGDYEDGWSLVLREDSTLWLEQPGWENMMLPVAPGTFVVVAGQAMGSIVAITGPDDDGAVTMTFALPTGDELVINKLP